MLLEGEKFSKEKSFPQYFNAIYLRFWNFSSETDTNKITLRIDIVSR